MSRQNGLCFQPKSITHIHTPPPWRRPVCTSAGVTGRIGVPRAGGEGSCRQEKGGVSCRKGGWCAVGSTSSQEGSRPSLRPPGPGQGLERLVFPASLELVSFGRAGPTSQASHRGKGALAFRLVRAPSGSDGRFPPAGTRRAPLRTTSLPRSGSTAPAVPRGVSCQRGLCCCLCVLRGI